MSQMHLIVEKNDEKGIKKFEEELEFFNENPDLYKFRKLKRIVVKDHSLTPRDTHPHLFYNPSQKTKLKIFKEFQAS